MTLLDKLERRIGFIAIPSLIKIIVAFTALVYVLTYLNHEFVSVLQLDPAAVLRGEVWRLITYIFIPRAGGQPGSMLGPLWAVVALWFLWFIGEGLERAWGAFRLTLYFLVGMIGTTVAAFLFGAQFSNSILAAALFFAFARFYPDEIIYIFFILPVKIKWLAWILAAFLMLGFVTGTLSYRMALVAALSNYFIFFGPEMWREFRHRKEVAGRRQRFEGQSRSDTEPLHRCATCGATELSDAELEFRVARDGEEYCIAHLPSAAATTAD
jgi:membrane associated rhomboid family serine protease